MEDAKTSPDPEVTVRNYFGVYPEAVQSAQSHQSLVKPFPHPLITIIILLVSIIILGAMCVFL